jgi:hypothetical protein
LVPKIIAVAAYRLAVSLRSCLALFAAPDIPTSESVSQSHGCQLETLRRFYICCVQRLECPLQGAPISRLRSSVHSSLRDIKRLGISKVEERRNSIRDCIFKKIDTHWPEPRPNRRKLRYRPLINVRRVGDKVQRITRRGVYEVAALGFEAQQRDSCAKRAASGSVYRSKVYIV